MVAAVDSAQARPITARRVAAGVVAILIAAAAGLALSAGRKGPGADSGGARHAPAFSLPELRVDRPPVTLAEVPGRPTVVNFFAAWCEPCKRELPLLRESSRRHAASVVFLGVDHQDSRSDAIELLDEFGITYPAGYDPRGDVAARYRLRGLPATVFVAANGRIVELHHGELNASALDERLRRLILQSRAS